MPGEPSNGAAGQRRGTRRPCIARYQGAALGVEMSPVQALEGVLQELLEEVVTFEMPPCELADAVVEKG